MNRWRQYRLRVAREALADAEHELDNWAFGMRPSEIAYWKRRIGKCERRVARLDPTPRASQGPRA